MKRPAVLTLLLMAAVEDPGHGADFGVGHAGPVRRLERCLWHKICCSEDIQSCQICDKGTKNICQDEVDGMGNPLTKLQHDAYYQSLFPSTALPDCKNGWGGQCGAKLLCSEPKLFGPASCPIVIKEARETGIKNLITSWISVLPRDDAIASEPDWEGKGWLCPTKEC